MNQYTHEVDFLRHEVERCHASMHSQIETLKLLMEAHLELKKKVDRPWASLTDEDFDEIVGSKWWEVKPEFNFHKFIKLVEDTLKEKNGG